MNIRKPTDYITMFTTLDTLMAAQLPQMELYREIGRVVSGRSEKGAAVAASEYLQAAYPTAEGFSPRNLRRMREFYAAYEESPEIIRLAMNLGWTQNVVILRPADPPGLHCQFGSIFVGAVELPHPAQIAGGETTRFRVCGLEIFRGGHRRPLLRSGADSPANFKVQLHLRQIYCHELIQYSIHSTVICGLSDVNSLLLSGAVRLLSPVSCNGNAPYAMRSRFGSLQFSVYPCFWNQLLSISATSSSGIFVPSVRASTL